MRKDVLDGFKLLDGQSAQRSSDAESLGVGDFHRNTESIHKLTLVCLRSLGWAWSP